MTTLLLAHGLGGRSDLPVPLWLAMYGAAAAVIISFFALGAFWRSPRFEDEGSMTFPEGLRGFIDSTVTRAFLKAFGLMLFVITAAALALGGDTSGTNPGPTWFYVWFWVGLVPASLLLGPVWRAVNPLRTIASGVLALARIGRHETLEYPSGLGYWPAAASLAAFVWLELVHARADDPSVVQSFILLYSLVHIAGGVRYGDAWFERADGFEVFSTLVAHMSFFGRRADGTIVLRNPFRGLAALDPRPGLVAVVSVLLGSTAFDGLTRTQWWRSLSEEASGAGYVVLGTAGLVAAVLFVAGTYAAATALDRRVVAEPRAPSSSSLRGRFVHSLLPIALGYTVAHYFSLLVFQGQAGLILASDPLSSGWNLFGTADWSINYFLVSTGTIALVQVGAIVAGHVAGVVAAHDRAVALFSGRDKVRAQYPLLGLMVSYTCGGIFLLVGT
jgi:hypothetical protein